MKKIVKMILVIFLITILNIMVLLNSVQAVENSTINIYTKGDFKRVIKFSGIVVKTAHAVYQENGLEYPAYCLNKDLHGVGSHIATYDVKTEGKITDLGLWKVIINGYPYKTIEQLGVVDEAEAYTATKQAVYCYIYQRGTENYEAIGEAGTRVINAIQKILQNAKNSTETFENPNIEILQKEEWEIDCIENQYLSKQYQIKSEINISKFIVDLEDYPDGCKITNLTNQEKKEFNSNETFKVLMPIASLERDGEFKIKIQTQMETKPIFYGKAPNVDLQDYALTAFSYEDVDTELIQKYKKNKTQLIIEKQDSETSENLEGACFEILDQYQNVISEKQTNKDGKIIIEQLIPGKYFIREKQAPEGYVLNSELIQIELKLNEKQIIEIKNTKIEIPEELPKEEIPEEEEPKTEEPLLKEPILEVPKLPITGM